MRAIRAVVVLAATTALLATIGGPATAGRLPGSPVGGAPFSAALDGQQEINPVTGEPGAGDLTASASAVATINPGRQIACYQLEHDLTETPFMFHIHDADAGVNGPIVVNFFTGTPGDAVPLAGCVAIDRALAKDILANPEGYYFNLHNVPFPGGAVRGQLSASSR
jgi:hypothetical protein